MADTQTEALASAEAAGEAVATARVLATGRWHARWKVSDVLAIALLGLVLLLMFIPILLMISMSLRRTTLIYADFWGLPFPPFWENYTITLFDLMAPLVRTLWVYVMYMAFLLPLASLSGYAFARMRFPGSEALFYVMVLLVMMIPGVITLTPNFVLAGRLGLKGNLWGLAITYIAGGQPFSIFLLTTYFRSQPEEMFESARVDGAGELRTLWSIAMPLARPILVTIAIMDFLSVFGDLIWPSLMLRAQNKTLMVALLNYNPLVEGETMRPRIGPITAAYVFSSIPPLILFIIGMRYYIQGLTSGAIKG